MTRLLDWIGNGDLPAGARVHESVLFFGDTLLLGPGCRIDAGTILVGNRIHVGPNVHIAPYCVLYGNYGIDLEEGVNIGAFGVLHSESESFTGEFPMGPLWPEGMRRPTRAAISIRRRATLGTRCTVLPGVVIGDGAIVGAHSLVRETIFPGEKWAGSPAKYIGHCSVAQLAVRRP